MRKLNWIPMLLCAACTGLAGAQEHGVRLPDIGSSAASAMSPSEMKQYGSSMLHEMRAYNYVLDDPLVSDYLHTLGYRLVSFSDRPDLDFTFFVVRSNEINAFAAPGGYIGVNIGLINAMGSEDELAAVIAHEIAHVTQQHLLRAFEDSRKSTIPIALAMLGALVATAGRSDDASQAAIVSGVSLMQQRAINFTRYDEIEADRVGIQSLSRAGYEPLAMAETFATMQRVMRVNGIDVPEFLRTHPVDVNRIADAKARAIQLDKSNPAATRQSIVIDQGVGPADSTPEPAAALDLSLPKAASVVSAAPLQRTPGQTSYFELMRERARTLNADSANAILRYYTDELKRNPERNSLANRYGHALALVRARQPANAVEEFNALVSEYPGSPVFGLGLADAEDQAGRKDSAFRHYEQLSTNYPGNRAIALAFTEALLSRDDANSARRAQDLLRPLLARYSEDPDLQRSFARANELGGDKVRAAEAYAEWAFLNGRTEDALNQLKTLSGKQDLTYYQRARVDARITAMTPIVLDLRKRERREDDTADKGGLSTSLRCPNQNCPDMSSRRNIPRLQ
ncbi:M48 family metalloprotease [Dokdonella sp.]|uniref:M48 family metalloprotease n=1 Tax=Dokdonella sp. TaxID=2291710 RepID=UPI002B507F00|nr:M48 family metalloprotease [Dokdonella sp.]HPN79917.1 M48 family metalloprotease [Dokdonella sp.]